mgnify:CR=1 FL=1
MCDKWSLRLLLCDENSTDKSHSFHYLSTYVMAWEFSHPCGYVSYKVRLAQRLFRLLFLLIEAITVELLSRNLRQTYIHTLTTSKLSCCLCPGTRPKHDHGSKWNISPWLGLRLQYNSLIKWKIEGECHVTNEQPSNNPENNVSVMFVPSLSYSTASVSVNPLINPETQSVLDLTHL